MAVSAGREWPVVDFIAASLGDLIGLCDVQPRIYVINIILNIFKARLIPVDLVHEFDRDDSWLK